MNLKAVKICCLLLGLALFFPAQAYCQNWKIFGWSMGGDCSLLYDEDRCSMQGSDVIRIPVMKMGWSSDCREKELANLAAMGLPGAELENWAQTIQVYEINLKTKSYRIISTSAFDMKGREIWSSRTASAWYCIVPGSATDKLHKALVGTEKNETQEVVIREGPVPQAPPAQQSPGQYPPSVPLPLYR